MKHQPDTGAPTSRYSVGQHLDPESSLGMMLSLIGGDRDVLDLGCAAGDLARALQQQRCQVTGVEIDPVAARAAEPYLQELVVGDLETLNLSEALPGRSFDVVVFGDVLEHVRDPLALLRGATPLLRPGASVVMSIPNVAHASVRLSLLRGEFNYRDTGLLDRTHLRFFTRESVLELLQQAGLVAVDVRRTVLGPFDSEIALDPASVPPGVLDTVMADPEAITYQFVLEAVLDDADGRVRAREGAAAQARTALIAEQARAAGLEEQLATAHSRAAEIHQELEAAASLQRELRGRVRAASQKALNAERDFERVTSDLGQRVDQAEREAGLALAEAMEAQARLAAVLGSTAWRVSKPVRALGPLRAALQGPVQNRRSLRRPGAGAAAARSLQVHGVRGTLERVRSELTSGTGRRAYADWVEQWGQLGPEDERLIVEHVIAEMSDGPVISVVVPVYDTGPELLAAAVASVRAQLYPRWELCLVDDASPSSATRAALAALAASDERIRVATREKNAGIAAATDDALAMATGDFVAFMDHDDVLAPHALYLVVNELLAHPDAALVYTDEDKIDADGTRYDPHFKPEFDAELLLGQNYLSHLTVMRRSLLEQLGGLDTSLNGAQDHDLVLRATELLRPGQVRHVPFVLYHWRQWSGSGTFSSRRERESRAASRAAVQAHLARTGQPDARVVCCAAQPGWNRVVRTPSIPLLGVTAVVPTRDRVSLLRPCVQGLLDDTDYPALRVLVVDNDSTDPDTLAYLAELREHPRVDVLAAPGPFNYSRINNLAVAQVRTPLTLLLNNDVIVREQDWLSEMVALLEVPGTGAVGAKLLYGDGRVQHAGVVLGIGGVAGHSHKYLPGTSTGYFGRLVLNQTVSAATAACLLVRTQTFLDLGGLNETDLAVAFNDVDLCLRIGETGQRLTFAANAVLDHLESASRGAEVSDAQVRRFNGEADWMRERWGRRLYDDPAYNPNLTDTHEDFSLAARPRVVRPWVGR